MEESNFFEGFGSIRERRMCSLLREEISRIICYELKDPRITPRNLCTVTQVRISSDMKTAHVNVSILGKLSEQRKVLRALQHAAGFIQSRASAELKLRYTPLITFFLDHSIEKSIRISHIIDECAKEIREKESNSNLDDNV